MGQIAAAESQINLQIRSGRPVVDGVYVNGTGPYRFLLDTGAQTNQMESGVAAKIGLKPDFRVELATASGVDDVRGTHTEILLGDMAVPAQELLLTSLAAVRTFDSSIQGVLGQEFLKEFDYLLDIRKRRLHISPIVVPKGERIDLETANGRILISTSLGRLVVDSGTDTMILFGDKTAMDKVEIHTAAGNTFAFRGDSQKVTIPGIGVQTTATVFVPRPPDTVEDGLVPATVLKAFYVSNTEKYLIVPAPVK
jgi:hypothetical protein